MDSTLEGQHFASHRPFMVLTDDVTPAMIQAPRLLSTCLMLGILSRLTHTEAMGTAKAQGTRGFKWQGLYRTTVMGMLDMVQSIRPPVQCRYEVML